MRLADYLTQNKQITRERFAEMIGTSVSTVYRIMAGEVYPTRSNIIAIERATEGQVTSQDLFEQARSYADNKLRTPAE